MNRQWKGRNNPLISSMGISVKDIGVSTREAVGRTAERGRQAIGRGYKGYKGEEIEGKSAAVGRFMRRDVIPTSVKRGAVAVVGEPVKRRTLGAAESVGALSEERIEELRAMEKAKQLEAKEKGKLRATAIREEAIAKHGTLEAAFRAVYHDILILARQGKAKQIDMNILHTMVQEAKVHGVDEDALAEITRFKKEIEGRRPSRYAGVATGAGRMGAAVVGSLAGGAQKMEGQSSVAGIRGTITDVREHPHPAAASGVGGIKRSIMDYTPGQATYRIDPRSPIYRGGAFGLQRESEPELPRQRFSEYQLERGPSFEETGEYYDETRRLPRGGWRDVDYDDERY